LVIHTLLSTIRSSLVDAIISQKFDDEHSLSEMPSYDILLIVVMMAMMVRMYCNTFLQRRDVKVVEEGRSNSVQKEKNE